MAVWVREYADSGFSGNTAVPIPLETGDSEQTLTQTVANAAGSVQSAAFQPTTRIVALQSDATVWVEFSPSDNPVAVVGKGTRLLANQQPLPFGTKGGALLAVINE